MKYIEEVLTKSKKNDKADIVSGILATIFFFSTFLLAFTFFNGSKLLMPILVLGVFLTPAIGYILGMKIGKLLFKPKKVEFKKTKLYKKLEKAGCLSEFIDTINKEIDKENTIKYYGDISGVGLIVTKTWFVFIDTKYPKFVKTSEIVKISDEFDINHSRFYMCLKLKNNKNIYISHLSCEDIEKEIKIKYPEIEIGTGSVDE